MTPKLDSLLAATNLVESVRSTGWGICDGFAESELFGVARVFGEPIVGRGFAARAIETLQVREPDDARKNSLSSIHGAGPFPLHTDGAHWVVPPRFLLLYSPPESDYRRVTLLADSAHLFGACSLQEIEMLQRGVIATRSGRQSRLTVISECPLRIRFDLACMHAATPTGARAIALVTQWLGTVQPVTLEWAPCRLVVIDNWRCFHGRGPRPTPPDHDRRLLRINIAPPKLTES